MVDTSFAATGYRCDSWRRNRGQRRPGWHQLHRTDLRISSASCPALSGADRPEQQKNATHYKLKKKACCLFCSRYLGYFTKVKWVKRHLKLRPPPSSSSTSFFHHPIYLLSFWWIFIPIISTLMTSWWLELEQPVEQIENIFVDTYLTHLR